MSLKSYAVAVAALVLAATARAETLTQHPALGVSIESNAQVLNAAHFIVGHPAGGYSSSGHANHDHPAVTGAREARGVDTNRYLVQPPASTRWTTVSAAQNGG